MTDTPPWLPIATNPPPQNGRPIQALCPAIAKGRQYGWWRTVWYFDEGVWKPEDDDLGGVDFEEHTHWAPILQLPEIPT